MVGGDGGAGGGGGTAAERLGVRGTLNRGSTEALLSAWFTVYGLALVVTGVPRTIAALRWTGIALLGLTAGKVFLLDLAQVEVLYRILSLLVLGVLLVAALFVYARYRSRLIPPCRRRGPRGEASRRGRRTSHLPT
ncbi:MAG: DUF2339 domain-containing protein [Armatimonadota bacterium]|nr:DUF2339 domain-containing protein [Armatimonadota bacterium]MDR7585104.1 DUF2339 domain-containing protein [Armatimonadota bacterium]